MMGGDESLVFPAMAFDSERTKKVYTNNLIRFYIGSDDADCLISDLDQAFRQMNRS